MIRVTNLQKKFNHLPVLQEINFQVDRGEVVAIVGPSGSGKSTLLRCLNMLELPDQGTIEIGKFALDVEQARHKDIHRLRSATAMVFQNYNLFKNKTALENVIESLVIGKKMRLDMAKAIGEELLAQVGLSHRMHHYPITLSGGEQQRVGIARALAVNPHVILLDEPTSALDPEWVSEVLGVIRTLVKKQTTMIIVTHEMSFAREVADKVIFMAEGRIVEQGKTEIIFTNPQQERTKKFLKQALVMNQRVAI